MSERRPRIGLVPFLPHRVPEDEELAELVGDQIAAALAQFSWLRLAQPSVHGYVAAPTNSNESQFDDLDYLVEGAVSRDGRRAHITVRLLDLGECARTIWSECSLVTIAKVQKWSARAASRIGSGIDPAILFFAGRPTQRRLGGATDLLRVAIPLMVSFERRKYEEAGRLIGRAVEMEPDNAMIAAWAAFWQVIYFGQGWTQNLDKASAIAQTRARRAVTLNPDDPEILTICGHVISFLCKDYDLAQYYFDRALGINPNLESAWCWSAATYSYIGKSGVALERLRQFQGLSALHPHYAWTQNICSVSYAFAGDYKRAVESARRVIRINPTFVNAYKPLIASLGHLGRVEEAKPYVDKLLALEPNFSLERFAKVYPIKYDSDREHYMKGLRLAGIPEN